MLVPANFLIFGWVSESDYAQAFGPQLELSGQIAFALA
jgi:hypothetical protein